jgi:hypothetical protein
MTIRQIIIATVLYQVFVLAETFDASTIAPLSIDSSNTAVLVIDKYPNDAIVNINDSAMGTTSVFTNIKSGYYKLTVKKDDKEISKYVFLKPYMVNYEHFYLERRIRYVFSAALSSLSGNSIPIDGYNFETGIQFEKHFLGLYVSNNHQSWNFHETSETGGLSLSYYYQIFGNDFCNINIGNRIGYWHNFEELSLGAPSSELEITRWYSSLPFVKIQIGYKYLFFMFEEGALLGPTIKNMLSYGFVLLI